MASWLQRWERGGVRSDVHAGCILSQRWGEGFTVGQAHTGCLEIPIKTSRACRRDLIDNFLNRNPSPEIYCFCAVGTKV